MTQDEIIELARQASFTENSEFKGCFVCNPFSLEYFAKLIAEREREACAKLFELTDLGGLKSDVWLQNYTATILDGYAKAIKARGQA
jgi:hypothetical protein